MFLLTVGAGFGATCATCAQLPSTQGDEIFIGGQDRVGVVELQGAIMNADDTVKQIRTFAGRDDLQAIVVRIDSPGGAVAPSQDIFNAMRFAAEKKPVVASMGNVAASGGLWAAMGADHIFAAPGSVTGSIGVITQIPDLRGVADLLRFNLKTYKSGPLKDAGNPFREATEKDDAMFKSLIDDIYGQFVKVIVERRGLTEEAVRKIADGRVMTGRAAKESGLVDELGGLHEAAKKAAELARARQTKEGKTPKGELEDPTLIYPKQPSPGLLELLTKMSSKAIADGVVHAVERVANTPPVLR